MRSALFMETKKPKKIFYGYTPDSWSIIKLTKPDNNFMLYKVVANFCGGYMYGDEWRINSGILHVKTTKHYYLITGYSGTQYKLFKNREGVRGIAAMELANKKEMAEKNKLFFINEIKISEMLAEFKDK